MSLEMALSKMKNEMATRKRPFMKPAKISTRPNPYE